MIREDCAQVCQVFDRAQIKAKAVQLLLKPGRKYAEAVKRFAPYERVQEPNDDARAAGAKLIAEGKAEAGKKKIFIYVNNRLEGKALETIDAMLDAAAS